MCKCRYETKQFGKIHTCEIDAWSNSRNGYCILHDPDPDKPLHLFNDKLKEQLDNKGLNPLGFFMGYYFVGEGQLFNDMVFKEPVHFREAQFDSEFDFRKVTFKDNVDFRYVDFKDMIGFIDVTFEKNSNFDFSYFYWVYFEGCNFHGQASFKEGNMHLLSFKVNTFYDLADYINCKFKKCSFNSNIFKGDVRFFNSCFEDKVDFNNNIFESNCYFNGVILEDIFECENVIFNNPENQELIYRKARKSWEQEGDRERADKYFQLEMIGKRKQLGPYYHKDRWPFHWWSNFSKIKEVFKEHIEWGYLKGWLNLIVRFFHWVLGDLTTAYGTSWLRVLFWWVGIIFGSTIIYSYFGSVIIDSKVVTIGFWKSLYFSIVTFATLGYGDIVPASNITKIVSSIESLTGAFFMAAFVLVFGRKFMR